jgi:hypothetical protein
MRAFVCPSGEEVNERLDGSIVEDVVSLSDVDFKDSLQPSMHPYIVKASMPSKIKGKTMNIPQPIFTPSQTPLRARTVSTGC